MQNNYFFNGMPNTPENFGMYGMNPGAMAYHHPMMPQGSIPSGNVEQLNITEEKNWVIVWILPTHNEETSLYKIIITR